jgi:hypothetical protein
MVLTKAWSMAGNLACVDPHTEEFRHAKYIAVFPAAITVTVSDTSTLKAGKHGSARMRKTWEKAGLPYSER